MNRVLLGFICLGWLYSPASAMVLGADSLVREDQTMLVESWESQADVTITETWRNDSSEVVELSVVLPTVGVSQSPTVFWQSEGQAVEKLELETAAATVYDLAREHQQSSWLGALAQPFDGWWQVKTLSLEPGSSGTLKYQFSQNLSEAGGFKTGTVFLADGWASESFTAHLVRAGQPQHWWAYPGMWTGERGPEAWARQWEATDYNARDNLIFFASDQPHATLSFNYAGQGYLARFKALEPAPPARVVMILDRSGSVYGARWERLQQAAKTLLEQMPETTQVQMGLLGNDLEWLDEEWEVNRREQQKTWLETLAGTNAQGKTSYEALNAGLAPRLAAADQRLALVLLGDWVDMPEAERQRLTKPGWRVLMVDFWQTESDRLKAWLERYGGQYVRLFNSGFELAEADLLVAAWQRLNLAWSEDKTIEANPEAFFPQIITGRGNQFVVEQTAPQAATSAAATILPRWWAARKLAAYLRQSLSSQLETDERAAIDSIADLFGVKAPNLSIDEEARWTQIQALEATLGSTSEILHWGAEPFYRTADRWQTQRWETAQPLWERPALALWSEAHRTLFMAEPQRLARPLSFGLSAFCAGRRCASVTSNGRLEPQPTDTLLWSETGEHWATNYWAQLVENRVITRPQLDYEGWAQPVSRGQFMDWLVGYLFAEAILPGVDQGVFSDLSVEQTGAAEALWLHDQGLMRGYDDGTARLDQPLKRIEALKLLLRARGVDTRDVLGNYDSKAPFTDLVGWTQPWGMEAYLRGLVRGYEDNTLRPFQDLTQAEAFKLLVESGKLID